MKQGAASPLVTTSEGPTDHVRLARRRARQRRSGQDSSRASRPSVYRPARISPGSAIGFTAAGVCFDCSPTSGRPIVIGPGGGSFTLDFGPQVAGPRISGTVRDAAGAAPLSTISIELYSPLGRLLGTATSDLAGHYVIRDPNSFATPFTIAPGSYYLRTRNNRGYVDEAYPDVVCVDCDIRIGTPVVVGSTDVTGIDFTLAAGGVVAGTVTDADGVALGGVPVSFFTAAGTLAGQALATSGGYFSASLPPGELSGARGTDGDARGRSLQRAAVHERCLQRDGWDADRRHGRSARLEHQLHAGELQRDDAVAAAPRVWRDRQHLPAGVLDEWRRRPLCLPGRHRRRCHPGSLSPRRPGFSMGRRPSRAVTRSRWAWSTPTAAPRRARTRSTCRSARSHCRRRVRP